MIGIEQFIEENNIDRPLLFLGKGPSFSIRHKFLLNKFFTIAANHAIKKVKADICAIIDVDVVGDCADEIYENCKYLMMPWHPHDVSFGYAASPKNLESFSHDIPVLKKMIDEGRVIFYNLSSAEEYNDESRIYATAINSADTLFHIFVANGIKTMHSLGVDGGKDYSEEFSDLTPLRNGRSSFDEQDPVIEAISSAADANFIRLQDKPEIKVFVGSTPEQLIPSLVLDFSIKKHTLNPSTVTPMFQLSVDHKTPEHPNCRPRTPFSFQRFFIPSLTDGPAFYMDSDMQVFKDVGKLLDCPFEGNDGLSASGMEKFKKWGDSNYAMLMLDCDNIKWDVNSIIDMLDRGDLTYEELMFKFKHAKIEAKLGGNGQWNSLDYYEEGETALLHYTDMGTQPWVHEGHPLEDLWVNDLREAISCGFIDKDLYDDHVSKRYLRRLPL